MSYCTTRLMGRCGNQFYQIATLIAYAKKHGFTYHVPGEATNCDNAHYFKNFPQYRIPRCNFDEKVNTLTHKPYYEEIPKIEGVCLVGYWQSFLYFEQYRKEVLDAFNLEYNPVNKVSIHVRRGDYLVYNKDFPPLPETYYKIAINHFQELGYKDFLVFSDDIPYCRTLFSGYKDCEFEFSEGRTELQDLSLMSSCQHNIVANSSFSYAASWLNRNEEKIVLTPDMQNMFKAANMNMIPYNYLQVDLAYNRVKF